MQARANGGILKRPRYKRGRGGLHFAVSIALLNFNLWRCKRHFKTSSLQTRTRGGWVFTFYQKDTYYYCFNMGGAMGELRTWKKEKVDELVLFLRKRKRQMFINTFRMKKIEVFYNGDVVSKMDPPYKRKRKCSKPNKPPKQKKYIKLGRNQKLNLKINS